MTNTTTRIRSGITFFLLFLASVTIAASHQQVTVAQSGIGGGIGGGGFSSASMTTIRSGIALPPESILVEEFYNYHFHDIPTPIDNRPIALDARWGNKTANSANRTAYLQVGLATNRDVDLDLARPLNLCFVIDHSSSMLEGGRLEDVKKSLLAALKKLRPVDRISIVIFNHNAETLVEPMLMDQPALVRSAITAIRADGSTNLNDGLVLGFQQVEKHLDAAYNNRVVLLTDGKANNGVTYSESIINNANAFIKKGIELSTIGLGQDYNHALLRQLSESGNGLLHFVGDNRDIEKVFVEELDGLLACVAQKPTLTIEFDQRLQVEHIYGYSPQSKRGNLVFKLDPLNSGTTQAILVKFKVNKRLLGNADIPVKVKLDYQNVTTGKHETLNQQQDLNFLAGVRKKIDPLTDPSVRRNVSIGDLAEGIKQMAVLSQDQKFDAAEKQMKKHLKTIRQRYQGSIDKHVKRVRKIAKNYLAMLEE